MGPVDGMANIGSNPSEKRGRVPDEEGITHGTNQGIDH